MRAHEGAERRRWARTLGVLVGSLAAALVPLGGTALAATTVTSDGIPVSAPVTAQYANLGRTGQGVVFGPLSGGAGDSPRPAIESAPGPLSVPSGASSRPNRQPEASQRVCQKFKLKHGRKLIPRRICATAATMLTFPMPENREVFGSNGVGAEVDEAVFTMAPGGIRQVTAQLEIRSTNPSFEVDMSIFCYDQQGQLIAPLPDTQTYPPDEPLFHGGGNGTNYVSQDDVPYQWNASMLIEAPLQNPEENYLCVLDARLDPGHSMTAIAPTAGESTYGTWLEVSAADEVGAQEAQTPYCGSTGTEMYSECQWVGGPASLRNPSTHMPNPTSANVTWAPPGGGEGPVWYWTAGEDATTIDAVATLQITDCYQGTSSCPPSEWGYHHGAADGYSYLEIDQLYPNNGGVCQAHQAYSEETSPDGPILLNEGFLSKDFAISPAQHHLPLYYSMSVPVAQTCNGSRRFAVSLPVVWTGGDAVKVDGGLVNVVDSAPTTTVPDVIGLTQAQADSALQAAGLTADVTYTHTPGPPGTVVSQNSPAGTTEPTGSPVQITVTQGVFAP